MINESIVMLLRGQIERMANQIETDDDDEGVDPHRLHQLADAAEDLMLAIRDRIGDSADAYSNASQGGP